MPRNDKTRIELIREKNIRLQAILGQIIDIIPENDLLLSSTIDIEWLLSKIEENKHGSDLETPTT